MSKTWPDLDAAESSLLRILSLLQRANRQDLQDCEGELAEVEQRLEQLRLEVPRSAAAGGLAPRLRAFQRQAMSVRTLVSQAAGIWRHAGESAVSEVIGYSPDGLEWSR